MKIDTKQYTYQVRIVPPLDPSQPNSPRVLATSVQATSIKEANAKILAGERGPIARGSVILSYTDDTPVWLPFITYEVKA